MFSSVTSKAYVPAFEKVRVSKANVPSVFTGTFVVFIEDTPFELSAWGATVIKKLFSLISLSLPFSLRVFVPLISAVTGAGAV